MLCFAAEFPAFMIRTGRVVIPTYLPTYLPTHQGCRYPRLIQKDQGFYSFVQLQFLSCGFRKQTARHVLNCFVHPLLAMSTYCPGTNCRADILIIFLPEVISLPFVPRPHCALCERFSRHASNVDPHEQSPSLDSSRSGQQG
jgi:hypothetical protein